MTQLFLAICTEKRNIIIDNKMFLIIATMLTFSCGAGSKPELFVFSEIAPFDGRIDDLIAKIEHSQVIVHDDTDDDALCDECDDELDLDLQVEYDVAGIDEYYGIDDAASEYLGADNEASEEFGIESEAHAYLSTDHDNSEIMNDVSSGQSSIDAESSIEDFQPAAAKIVGIDIMGSSGIETGKIPTRGIESVIKKSTTHGIYTTEVLELLMPILKTVSCSARCSKLFIAAPNSFKQCKTTCEQLQQKQQQSVCEHNCPVGCQVACQAYQARLEIETGLDLQVSMVGCSLSWTTRSAEDLEFLLVARDRQGMLYQIGSTTSTTSTTVPQALLDKASAVIVIGVGPRGVAGLGVQKVEHTVVACGQSQQVPIVARQKEEEEKALSVSSTAVVLVITLAGLLIVLVCLMLALLGLYTRQQQHSNVKQREDVWKADEGFEYNLYPGHFQPYISEPITL